MKMVHSAHCMPVRHVTVDLKVIEMSVHFYHATACNATHSIAITILSVHPSVRYVYSDKTK